MARRSSSEIEEEVASRYLSRESVSSIATAVGVSTATVKRIRQRLGLPSNPRDHRGSRHPRWKGGRYVSKPGYVILWADPLDSIAQAMADKSNSVREHRLVMAHSLGRPLTRTETVHHKNGVRHDNRIENLELRQGNHGPGVIRVCLDCGSHNIKEDIDQ